MKTNGPTHTYDQVHRLLCCQKQGVKESHDNQWTYSYIWSNPLRDLLSGRRRTRPALLLTLIHVVTSIWSFAANRTCIQLKKAKQGYIKGYTWRIYSFYLCKCTHIRMLTLKMVSCLWCKAKAINTIHHLNSWLNKWSSLCIVAELVNKCLKHITHAYES